MKINETKFQKTIIKLLKLFSEKNYEGIAEWSHHTRLTKEEIKLSVEEYNREIILPAGDFWDSVDITEIIKSVPVKWSVIFPFWTNEEGKSDLSAELTLIDSVEDIYDIEIDNIHTL